MVQIQAILIIKTNLPFLNPPKPIILAGHVDSSNSWISWFYKDTIREFAVFFGKLLAERITPPAKSQVSKDNLISFVDAQEDGLTSIVVTDETYPKYAGFKVARIALDKFREDGKNMKLTEETTKDFCLAPLNTMLQQLMQQCQDPLALDKMQLVKDKLEDVKNVALQSMDKLLARGESIDSLIDRTDQLSNDAKSFYRKARSNKCCGLV